MPLSGLPVAWASCRGRLRPCIVPERRSPLPVPLLTRSRPNPPCKANEDPQDSDRERQAHGLESTALPDHAAVCAQAALEMLENLRSFNRRYQIDWAVRIGMNSGPVIGGSIGKKNSLTTFGARP